MKKKRFLHANNDDFEDDDCDDEEFDDHIGENINVEFEARSAEDFHFHGIRKLLEQLFLKANVNLTELTNLIISHNNVGSVIGQVCDIEDIMEEEADEDDMGENSGTEDVFGVVTAINISEKKHLSSIQELKKLLLSRCKLNCPNKVMELENILSSSSYHVGLILNERFINIPPQISLPTFEALWDEVDKANKKGMNYNFTHYAIISKTHRMPQATGPIQPNEQLIFINEEEEFFHAESSLMFSYSVANERDKCVGGTWDDDDTEMEPFRTFSLITVDKLPIIMNKLREILK